MIDRETRRTLFSRGFSSIYGEWETTGEATDRRGSFEESLRFPLPERAVQVVVGKRDARNDFVQVWSTVIDPADILVDRSAPPSAGALLALQTSGPSADKVGLILGDGYTGPKTRKCEADARRLTAILFETEPFRSRRTDFNVWGLCPEARSRGSRGRRSGSTGARRQAAPTTFRSERYVLSLRQPRLP
ncbi:MAG: M64 family metallopeptidase [Thermoanaerobaculia bacterium]